MGLLKPKKGRPAFDAPSKSIQNARSRIHLNMILDTDKEKLRDIDINDAKKLLNDETGRRLIELIDYYKIINDDDYFQLALCLANDFVENFDIFTKPTIVGRKKGRSMPTGFALFKAVETILIKPCLSA